MSTNEPSRAAGVSESGTLRDEENEVMNEEDEEDYIEEQLERAGLVEPPDGGWGWVVVLGSFFANMFVDGIIFTAGGAFQPLWEREYGASSSAASLPVSLLSGCYLLAGPLVSALANYFGCRRVVFAGTFLASTGFLLSIFSPNLPCLYVTFGIMGGIGFGMIYLPAVVIVSYYFKKQRALATGLAVCGSGIGTFVFAPLIQLLLTYYTWQQTVMILSALILNCIVCGAVFRSLQPSKKQVEKVREIAMEFSQQITSTERLHSLNVPSILVEEASDSNLSHVEELTTMLDSPRLGHVAEGAKIERFTSGGRTAAAVARKSRARTLTERPFMSVMELNARKRRTSFFDIKKTADLTSATNLAGIISRECVDELNRPMSRMDIFYAGSFANLTGPPLYGGQRRMSTAASKRWTPFFDIKKTADLTSATNLAGIISRECVDELNRPMSRMDIFYAGSFANLTGPPLYGGQRRMSTAARNRGMSVLSIPPIALSDGGDYSHDWKKQVMAVLKSMLDLSLLKSPSFVLIALGGSLTLTGFFVPFIYISRHAVAGVGASGAQATALVSVLGITNIVARIFCGWLSDRPNLDALMIHNVAVTIGGLATVAVPFLTQYWMLVVYCVVFGFGTACFASLRSIICVEVLGLERLTNAFGFMLLFMGVAALIGSPIAGLLFDLTGDYTMSFVVMGSLIALSGVIGIPLRRISIWEAERDRRRLADENADFYRSDNGGANSNGLHAASDAVELSSMRPNAAAKRDE